MSASWLRMDLSPLAGRDFRATLAIGLLGAAELVPLVVFAPGGQRLGRSASQPGAGTELA